MRILLCASLAVAPCSAQGEGGGGGGGGGRGGRGGSRGGRGAASRREFLGLGANGATPDEEAAKKGEPLYKQHWGACHGERARGAQAPNLVRSVVVLHDEKGEEIGPVSPDRAVLPQRAVRLRDRVSHDTSDKPEGYGGRGGGNFDNGSVLLALDVRTGAVKWKHEHASGGFGGGGMSGGILTTAGRLLVTGDSGQLVAFDPANGNVL